MKKLITLLAITITSLVYSQDFTIVSPYSAETNINEILNNWPLQVVMVKTKTKPAPTKKYYVNFDGKIIDSFLYKDFVGDTLRKNYMIKVNNTNIHYLLFGSVEFLFRAVSVLTGLEEESVSDQRKHRYFDMLGREILEPKGMCIRDDGKRFVYE